MHALDLGWLVGFEFQGQKVSIFLFTWGLEVYGFRGFIWVFGFLLGA